MARAREKLSKARALDELLPWQSPELLRELGLLTQDGALNADARRKLKQVTHFLRLIEPGVRDVLARQPKNASFCEFGSGNAYLAFNLHAAFLASEAQAETVCVEARADLADRVRAKSKRLDLQRLYVRHGNIDSVTLPARIHFVLALHACDTASDDAIVRAVEHNADHIALVPCCQAELNRQLDVAQTENRLVRSMRAYPMQKREFASGLTNHIRAQVLVALGYEVTVTEFVGLEHSFKNELILARKVKSYDREAAASISTLCQELDVKPKTLQALRLRDELQESLAATR